MKVPATECNVYFGDRDVNRSDQWKSCYSEATVTKDLSQAMENRRVGMSNGQDNYKPHFKFGNVRGSDHWFVTNKMPMPEKGVDYAQKAADGKKLVARTNWDLGDEPTLYETGAMELNRHAKPPCDMIDMKIPEFQTGKPPEVKKEMNKKLLCNVTLGVDTFEYVTDSQRNFVAKSQDRDFAAERATNAARKKELQKTNFELGQVPTEYYVGSQLWSPDPDKGYPKAHELRSAAFDPKILRKTNYTLGLAKADWTTDKMRHFADPEHLKRMDKAVRNPVSSNGADVTKTNVVIGDWKGKTETAMRGDFLWPPASAYSLDRTRQKEMKKALTRTNMQLSAPGSKSYFETTNRNQMESHTAEKYKPRPSAKAERKRLKQALSRSNFELGPHKTDYRTDSTSAHCRFGTEHYAPPDIAEQKRRKKLLAASNFEFGYKETVYETSNPHQGSHGRRRRR
jgi:hypothetical protein